MQIDAGNAGMGDGGWRREDGSSGDEGWGNGERGIGDEDGGRGHGEGEVKTCNSFSVATKETLPLGRVIFNRVVTNFTANDLECIDSCIS